MQWEKECDTVTFSILAQRLISSKQNQKQLSLTSFKGKRCSKSTTVQVNLQDNLLHSIVKLTQTCFSAHSHIFSYSIDGTQYYCKILQDINIFEDIFPMIYMCIALSRGVNSKTSSLHCAGWLPHPSDWIFAGAKMSNCVHPTRLWSLIVVQEALHRDSELDKAL